MRLHKLKPKEPKVTARFVGSRKERSISVYDASPDEVFDCFVAAVTAKNVQEIHSHEPTESNSTPKR